MGIMTSPTTVVKETEQEPVEWPEVYVEKGSRGEDVEVRLSASEAKRRGLAKVEKTEKADPETKKRIPAASPKTETPDVKTK